jgi:hypothetical protein
MRVTTEDSWRRSVAIEDGKLNGTMEGAHFHTFIYTYEKGFQFFFIIIDYKSGSVLVIGKN